MGKQNQTPLLKVLQTLSQKRDSAFYAPGHKRGQGVPASLSDLIGKAVFHADLPELPELDNLFAPEGVIKSAQELAAEAFGAEQTYFLANGSTCGIIAAILAVCGEGEKIILPRNSHISAIAGLILSGAAPIFINPEYDPSLDLVLSITPEAVAAALKEHPDAKGVMMVYPTYHGICGEINAIAQITHRNNIPLIVDEAHGAHLHFHPSLPPSALAMGADITIQSTHKTLSAFSQASMLHRQGKRVSSERIRKALQLVQSTSPNYLLLASLDAARQQMATQGQELLEKTLNLVTSARNRLKEIPTITILESQQQPGFANLDPTRLTVYVNQLGLSGFAADEILHEQLQVTAELPMQYHLAFIISLGNTQRDIDELVQGFTTLVQNYSQPPIPIKTIPFTSLSPLRLSPRKAYFAETQTIPISKAVGHISAEIICPYPPGIPILMPGEEITQFARDYLQEIVSLGGKISGCSDMSLNTIKVVD